MKAGSARQAASMAAHLKAVPTALILRDDVALLGLAKLPADS